MTFIKNNYFKILLSLAVLVGLPYWLYQSKKYNSKSTKDFFTSNVNGKIKEILDGSGGFEIIRLENGDYLRFFSIAPGGIDFDDVVNVGDSISKPAESDTIKVYTSSGKEMKFTFFKP